MKSYRKRYSSTPCIHTQENVTIYANVEFEILTGFLIEEMLGKTMTEIIKLLNADSQIKFKDIHDGCKLYIFTKECNPREVKVSCMNIDEENKCIYYFNEIRESRIENNYPYLLKVLPDNDIAVAIYSVPKCILLKANEKYTNYLNDICDNNTNKVGRPLIEFIPNYIGSNYENSFTIVMKTGIPKYFKDFNDYAYQDGNKYWDGSLVPVYREGKMKHIVHTGIDVTERVVGRKIVEIQKNELKKQKEVLEEQRKELIAIIENISDEVIIFDKSGKYNILNKATRDNSIYDVETTRDISDFSKLNILYDMDGNLIPFENTLTNRVIRGEKIKDSMVIRKNDDIIQIREVNGTPIYDDNGNFMLGVLVSRDISERIKNEESNIVKKQYETLSNIINNTDLGFARITYPDFRLIEINHKAFSIVKKVIPSIESLQSIYNQNLFEILNLNDSIKAIVLDAINNNGSNNFFVRKYVLDGKEVFYKYIFQPLNGINNDTFEVLVIAIDVTEDETNKYELRETIKIQDELYTNVSHELRTPLNIIFSANQFMDILLKSNPLELNIEKLVSYNTMVKQNCYKLTKLINNIIDLSKGKSGFLTMSKSDENIVEIIKNIVDYVSEYTKLKELSIVFQSNINERIIACDSYLIERAMLNLISNAIKFSKPESDINVRIINKEQSVEILVIDTGIGMDEKTLKQLFKRYYQADRSLTRRSEGSGIGLSLVKTIVELHAGNIRVTSELNKGSTFIVELPATITGNPFIEKEYYKNDKIEMINIELSDIFSTL